MNDDAAITCAASDVMHFSSDEVESGRALNEDTNASSSSVNDVSCLTQLVERDAADSPRTSAHGGNLFWPDGEYFDATFTEPCLGLDIGVGLVGSCTVLSIHFSRSCDATFWRGADGDTMLGKSNNFETI